MTEPSTGRHPGGAQAFQPKRSSDYVLSSRPVIGLKDEYPAGFVDPEHSHHRAQLLYACAGVMTVFTGRASYAVPPQRALWLDAGLPHEVSCRSRVSLRTLYIDPKMQRGGQGPCRLVEVSAFLQALIIEVVDFDTATPMDERQELIVRLLLREIWRMPHAPYQVRMPSDRRLIRACRLITENVANAADLDGAAAAACMSRRAFTRLFRHETGMSFAVWRQQVRLMEALSMIEDGRSITATAYEIGYASPSAFSAAFQRTFGVSPSKYRSQ